MKKLLFTLGAALMTIINANAENKIDTCESKGGIKIHDTAIVQPVSLTTETAFVAIAEDAKITEAAIEVAAPLLPGKSLEEVIAGDNLVIGGNTTREIFPLDFKKIHAEPKNAKKPAIRNNGEKLMGSL